MPVDTRLCACTHTLSLTNAHIYTYTYTSAYARTKLQVAQMKIDLEDERSSKFRALKLTSPRWSLSLTRSLSYTLSFFRARTCVSDVHDHRPRSRAPLFSRPTGSIPPPYLILYRYSVPLSPSCPVSSSEGGPLAREEVAANVPHRLGSERVAEAERLRERASTLSKRASTA